MLLKKLLKKKKNFKYEKRKNFKCEKREKIKQRKKVKFKSNSQSKTSSWNKFFDYQAFDMVSKCGSIKICSTMTFLSLEKQVC